MSKHELRRCCRNQVKARIVSSWDEKQLGIDRHYDNTSIQDELNNNDDAMHAAMMMKDLTAADDVIVA